MLACKLARLIACGITHTRRCVLLFVDPVGSEHASKHACKLADCNRAMRMCALVLLSHPATPTELTNAAAASLRIVAVQASLEARMLACSYARRLPYVHAGTGRRIWCVRRRDLPVAACVRQHACLGALRHACKRSCGQGSKHASKRAGSPSADDQQLVSRMCRRGFEASRRAHATWCEGRSTGRVNEKAGLDGDAGSVMFTWLSSMPVTTPAKMRNGGAQHRVATKILSVSAMGRVTGSRRVSVRPSRTGNS